MRIAPTGRSVRAELQQLVAELEAAARAAPLLGSSVATTGSWVGRFAAIKRGLSGYEVSDGPAPMEVKEVTVSAVIGPAILPESGL